MAPTTRSQTAADAADTVPIAAFPYPTITSKTEQSNPARRLDGFKGNVRKSRRIWEESDDPPTYTIDLSLPPTERYVHLAKAFQPQLQSLTSLFDEVVEDAGFHNVGQIKKLAKLFLRRLWDPEQTEEIRGIAKAAGVDLYLLVAFNTLLDLLMGCTSGGVRTEKNKMMHFRTLDWGMNGLRDIVVVLEFVERKGGQVIARSVTYVGYVGILTGVRPNLSLSLNFRPTHNATTKLGHLMFYGHNLLVLLGFKQSISSILRSYILPPASPTKNGNPSKMDAKPDTPDLASILTHLPATPSTAAYVILSNGVTTTILEKDRATAHILSSDAFIVAMNHDVDHEDRFRDKTNQEGDGEENTSLSAQKQQQQELKKPDIGGIADLLTESIDRKACLSKRWRDACAAHARRHDIPLEDAEAGTTVPEKEVLEWLLSYPVVNECTHYAVLMDPREGEVSWVRRWKEPVQGRGRPQ